MFRSFGPLEIGLIVLVILIVFGAGKLSQVGSAFGKSIREFRKATHGDDADKDNTAKSQPTQTTEGPAKS